MFLTHLYFQSKIRREWRDLWPHLNVGYNTRVKSLLKVEIYTKPGENDAAKVKASSLVTAAGLRQTGGSILLAEVKLLLELQSKKSALFFEPSIKSAFL